MSPESCVPKPACITLGLRPELEGVITVWVALFLTLLTLVQWCMTLMDMGLTEYMGLTEKKCYDGAFYAVNNGKIH